MKKLALKLPGGYTITDPLPAGRFEDIGDVINRLVPYIFAIAGLTMLFVLLWGGFEWMTSAGNPEKTKSAQGKITSAIVGFLIIFAAYWIVEILEVVFGITILG